jgi:NAD(P)H-dependent FMN reductase
MFTFDMSNKVKVNMNTILFIIGSTRLKSFNRQVAKYVEGLLKGKANVKYFDFTELPFINQDKEEPVQEVVSEIRKEVMKADGLWVFSPEYNYSYPGYIKNLFDWLSRPNDPTIQNGPTAIAGKKITITGAGGTFATRGMKEKLTELLGFIKADVMKEPMTGIHVNPDAWGSNVLTLSKEDKEHLQKQAETFLQFI